MTLNALVELLEERGSGLEAGTSGQDQASPESNVETGLSVRCPRNGKDRVVRRPPAPAVYSPLIPINQMSHPHAVM
jgi:hypothetical protein